MLNTQITVALSAQHWDCKPEKVWEVDKDLCKHYQQRSDTRPLYNALCQGHAIIPAFVDCSAVPNGAKSGRRAENWREQRLFMVDIDNCDKNKQILPDGEYLPYSKAVELCESYGLKVHFAYYSYSSDSPKTPFERYRLAFLLDQTVTDESKRLEIMQKLISIFGAASDNSTKDGSRLFYGTTPDKGIDFYGSITPLENVLAIKMPEKANTVPAVAPDIVMPAVVQDDDQYDIDKLLNCINPDLDYDIWLTVSGCYKKLGGNKNTWLAWCATSGKSDPRKDDLKWDTLNGKNTKIGTLIKFAKETPQGKNYVESVQKVVREKERENKNLQKMAILSRENNILADHYDVTGYNQFWITDKNNVPCRIVELDLARQFFEHNKICFCAKKHSDDFVYYLYKDGYYQIVSKVALQNRIVDVIEAYNCGHLIKNSLLDDVFNLMIKTCHIKRMVEDDFNSNENIVCFQNGTLHLDTMDFTESSPDDLCSIQIQSDYLGEQPTPFFDSVLETLTSGSKALQTEILEVMGLALSNVKGSHYKMGVIFWGESNTGKSQIRNLLEALIGSEFVGAGDFKTLESRFGASSLVNKRLYGMNDMSFMKVDELKMFKLITGDDLIPIEYKGKDLMFFRFKGVLMFSTNQLPMFGGDKSEGVYKRFLIIPCHNVIPESQWDTHLVEKMLAERTGIIHKCLMALKRTVANGHKFTLAPESIEMWDYYKHQNSPYLQFFDECCVPLDKNTANYLPTKKSVMHDTCRDYVRSNFNLPFNLRAFQQELANGGIDLTEYRCTSGRYYKTFTLSEEFTTKE